MTDRDIVVRALAGGPATARELAQRLGRSRREINSVLYRHGGTFDHDGEVPPRWFVVTAPPVAGVPASREGSPPDAHDHDPGPPVPVVRSKEAALKAILDQAGSVASLTLGPGSTEPKALFVEVSRGLELGLDESLSKVELARLIVERAGRPWPSNGDSTTTPSGGGDTVTLAGLQAVLRAVVLIKDRTEVAGQTPPTAPEYRVAAGGIEASPVEITRDWDALDAATRAHAELQNRVAEAIRDAGLEPRSPGAGEPGYDIAWKAGGRFVVCEVKSTTAENARQQVRLALGQVLEYRKALEADHSTVVAVIACQEPPPPETRRAAISVGVRIACEVSLEADLGPLV